jgi:hypothetical protein
MPRARSGHAHCCQKSDEQPQSGQVNDPENYQSCCVVHRPSPLSVLRATLPARAMLPDYSTN